jgi:enoyl-CoA hydratase/carnithine racemase
VSLPPSTPSAQADLAREILTLRLDATEIQASWEGVFLLEEALDRLAEGAASRLRVVRIEGDAEVFSTPSLGTAGSERLRSWGARLNREAQAPGSLRVGWASGAVRGPLLEILLACDLLWLGPRASVALFPPREDYLPVAGSWSRAIRRVGAATALGSILGDVPWTADEAVHFRLASGIATAERLDGLSTRLAAGNERALGAIAELGRRTPGLGEAQGEALERAVFSWCFAAGDPPGAIRSFLDPDGRRDQD